MIQRSESPGRQNVCNNRLLLQRAVPAVQATLRFNRPHLQWDWYKVNAFDFLGVFLEEMYHQISCESPSAQFWPWCETNHCSSQASSFWVIGCFLTLLPPPSSSGVAFLNLLVFALVEFYKTTLFDAPVYLGELESHWQTVSTSNLPIQTVIDCLLKQGCYLRRCTGWLKHPLK